MGWTKEQVDCISLASRYLCANDGLINFSAIVNLIDVENKKIEFYIRSIRIRICVLSIDMLVEAYGYSRPSIRTWSSVNEVNDLFQSCIYESVRSGCFAMPLSEFERGRVIAQVFSYYEQTYGYVPRKFSGTYASEAESLMLFSQAKELDIE